jgi:hypothetical protein
VGGKSLKEHLEATNHAHALDSVHQLAAAKSPRRVTETDILRLHELVLNGIDEANAGRYRRVSGSTVVLPNPSKRCDAATGGHATGGQPTEGCCNTQAKPRSHDTSRIAWAKLMSWVGEEFPLDCPNCGGDIRLRDDGRQEPAHIEPEVRKLQKARKASPA